MAESRTSENTGWFVVPGIRECADRTLAEQMIGLDQALRECKGRTVLDLGTAEGLIALEFAKAGASRVVGIEKVKAALNIAEKVCEGRVELIHANLERWMPEHPQPEQFDIVLALGIIHKPRNPEHALRWAVASAKDLFVFRPPGYEVDGYFESKRTMEHVHAPTVLRQEGFSEEARIEGAHGEHVEYWRRISPR